VSPGAQSGSGGIIRQPLLPHPYIHHSNSSPLLASTAPDMVKWYTSLFVKRNATVLLGLNNSDIDLLIYPWSLMALSPIPQYYGLGVDLIFVKNPPTSPPPAPALPDGIDYMGGSMCSFFSIVLWLANFSAFDPSVALVTYPLISVAARNNRVLNVTKSQCAIARQLLPIGCFCPTNFTRSDGIFTDAAATSSNNGTWYDLTTGWGFSNPDLTETEFLAANTVSIEVTHAPLYPQIWNAHLFSPQLFYFATQPFSGPVQAAQSQVVDNGCPAQPLSAQPGVISAIAIACCAFAVACAALCHVLRRPKQRSSKLDPLIPQ